MAAGDFRVAATATWTGLAGQRSSSARAAPAPMIRWPDPADLTAFGSAACRLLGDQDQAARMGQAAHAHVREQYVGDAHLLRYASLLGTLIGEG